MNFAFISNCLAPDWVSPCLVIYNYQKMAIFYYFFFLFQKTVDPGTLNKMFTRSGYLFLSEKKALGTTWNKYYCHYQREGRLFCMIPYNQATGKMMSTESFRLKTCTRRISDSIDKRFCFDITPEDRYVQKIVQILTPILRTKK